MAVNNSDGIAIADVTAPANIECCKANLVAWVVTSMVMVLAMWHTPNISVSHAIARRSVPQIACQSRTTNLPSAGRVLSFVFCDSPSSASTLLDKSTVVLSLSIVSFSSVLSSVADDANDCRSERDSLFR